MSAAPFWKKGIRFECQGSGKCCVSRGSYGYVYLTRKDLQKLAKGMGLGVRAFEKRFCEKAEGATMLKNHGDDCIFLKNHRCEVYEDRPTQCRTWPFWPELMKNQKSWNEDVARFCPGVGKGDLVPEVKIKEQMEEQRKSDLDLFT